MSNSVDPTDQTPRLIPINVSKTLFVTYPPPPLIMDWVNMKITQPGSLLNKQAKEDTDDQMKKEENTNKRLPGRSTRLKGASSSKGKRNSAENFLNQTFTIDRKKPLEPPSETKEESGERKKPLKTTQSRGRAKTVSEVLTRTTEKKTCDLTSTPTRSTAPPEEIKKRTARMRTCIPTNLDKKVVPLKKTCEVETVTPIRRTSRTCIPGSSCKAIVPLNNVSKDGIELTRTPTVQGRASHATRKVVPLRSVADEQTSTSVRSTRSLVKAKCSSFQNEDKENKSKTAKNVPRMRSCAPTYPCKTVIPLKGSVEKPGSRTSRDKMKSCTNVPSKPIELNKSDFKSKRTTCMKSSPSAPVPQLRSDVKRIPRMKSCIPSLPSRVVIPSKTKTDSKANRKPLRMKSCVPTTKNRIAVRTGTQEKVK